MRSSAEILLGVSLSAVGFAHACVPPFTCETDEQCDAQPGGRCDADNHCVYDEPSTGPGTTAASVDPTTAGPDATTDTPATTEDPVTTQPAETDSNTTTAPDPTTEVPDTETAGTTTVDPTDPPDPPPCDPLDERYASISGKPSGLAVAPDGTLYLAGVSSTAPYALSVQQVHPDGSLGWFHGGNMTGGGSADHDTDIWLRAFLTGGDLVVAYSLRTLDSNNQDGPYVDTFDPATGDTVATSDLAASLDRSLRGASLVDADTLLVAGEHDENVWYQRLDRAGTQWDPAWPSDPSGFTPTGFYQPAIAQGIAAAPGGRVFVGGTWDDDLDAGLYRAWLRGLSLASGDTDSCECERFDAGILALDVGAGGELYVGGFQGFGESGTWFGRFDPDACPANCQLVWNGGSDGAVDNTEFYRAEFVQDAIYSVVAVPGGVVFAGAQDKKPFAARYDADGSGPTWTLGDPAAVDNAAVLAASVSPDGSCLTLVGSADYSTYAAREWWVHREQLP